MIWKGDGVVTKRIQGALQSNMTDEQWERVLPRQGYAVYEAAGRVIMEIWLEYLDGAYPHIAQECVQNDGYRMVQMLDELFLRRSLDRKHLPRVTTP